MDQMMVEMKAVHSAYQLVEYLELKSVCYWDMLKVDQMVLQWDSSKVL